MAKKSTAAQHFLECDNCEEHPAKFLCKPCSGHLCENCKTEHEKKRMTRSHEIVSLISNNENMVDLLYCTKHTKKKVECYCDRCKEPVCTDCIIQSHNGHSVESLSTVYKRITDGAKQQKEKIDNVLLPKYRELVSKETAKGLALKRRTEEIKKKMEAHTNSLVKMLKTIGKQAVKDLSKKEKDGLRELEQTKNSLDEQINELQQMSSTISANIEAKPDISFFKLGERNNLERFERTLPETDYSFTDFQPGKIGRALQDSFGIRPILQKSGNNSCSDKEVVEGPIKILRPYPSSGYSPYREYGRRNADESDKKVVEEPVKIQPSYPTSGLYAHGYTGYGEYERRNPSEVLIRAMMGEGDEKKEEKN
eukprot:XP_019929413.1 PREDICTED: tripartite motif-containing protein 45 isoform X1 [Crassostrea gigas]